MVDAALGSGFVGYPLIDWKTGECPRDRASIGALMASDDRLRRRVRDGPLLERIADRAHLRDVEELLRPVGGEQDAALVLRCVADADLVIDVAVRDRHVGEHEIGEIEPLDHLGDDERAGVLIRAHRLVAERLNGRSERAVPERVEVDLARCVAARLDLSRLAPVRHDHEADWLRHPFLPPSKRQAGAPRQPHNFRVSSQARARPFAHFLHHVARAARAVAALSVPEADEVDPVRAEARSGVEHPAVVAFVRVLARGRRAELDRLDMERRPRFRGEEARAPAVAGEVDRFFEKRRLVEGDIELEPRAARERRLGEQEIAAAGAAADGEIARARRRDRTAPRRWRPPRSAPCPAESAASRGRARRSCGR